MAAMLARHSAKRTEMALGGPESTSGDIQEQLVFCGGHGGWHYPADAARYGGGLEFRQADRQSEVIAHLGEFVFLPDFSPQKSGIALPDPLLDCRLLVQDAPEYVVASERVALPARSDYKRWVLEAIGDDMFPVRGRLAAVDAGVALGSKLPILRSPTLAHVNATVALTAKV